MTHDRRYLYDDRLTILFNCKDGNKTYTFAEIETAQKVRGCQQVLVFFICFGSELLTLMFEYAIIGMISY